MDFRILGPLEATSGGRPVVLGGHKPRVVLASLLLNRGRLVTVDRLIDDVWADRPPPSAVNALQTYVSRLRGVLGEQTLVRRHGGYTLVVATGGVDADRFETLLGDGRAALAEGTPQRAVDLLDAAERLWRGPVLAGLRADSVRAEAARLTELRHVAAEARIEALLALGRAAEAAAAAQAVVSAHPLRERARAHLMLAFYRQGREAEALDVYHELRALLADEFGLDPGAQLAELAQAILRRDPELVPAAPVPPRPRKVTPTRVTVPVDRFIGRRAELTDVDALLRAHRLVTLTGPGGSGKTRLARHLCHDLDLPVYMVELADLTDAALVEATVAEAFGLAVLTDLAAVADAVADDPAVLLLDNCEHLVEALAPVVTRLLVELPRLRVLATSRQPLSIGGERRYPVPPLPAGDEAVELFTDRAAALLPDWAATAADSAAIGDICAALDGLPLAVELAAAQTVALSPTQIRDSLDPLSLGAQRRDLPDRHRSLSHVIGSSHRLLSRSQRDLFTSLSVFAGTFDADAVAAVAGTDVPTLLPDLTGLINSSLLVNVPGPGRRRYRMLETLRRYAGRDLDPQQRLRLGRRHLDWLLPLVAAADQGLRGPDAPRWLGTLRAEQANIRAALAFALGGPAPEDGLRLAADSAWFWYRRSHVAEGTHWLSMALAAVPGARDEDRTRVLTGLACLRYLVGDLAASGEAITAAMACAERGGTPATLARAHIYHAYFLGLSGQVERAGAAGRVALERARNTGADWLVAEALIIVGFVERISGAATAAAATLDESIRVGSRAGFDWSASSGRWMRANLAVDVADYADAYRLARRGTVDLDAQGDVTGWLAGVELLAGTLGMTGRPGDGATLLGAVSALGRQVGYQPEQMDPMGSRRNVAAVRERLSPDVFEAAFGQGARLSREQVRELVARLPDGADGGSGRG
ncbi:BTAD domain-containing putative transcriptional regulator [Polymorphospora rubra]|uniref:BTAD domain-containing putative transcriptional regulator n=1 Tax=Polymorphospora rubra TaxID=338584 RepID=UPI0033DC8172